MNLSSTWKAVEELERSGETVQVIEGTLTLGKDSSTPEYQYQMNATLSTNDDNYYIRNKRQKIIYFSTPHTFPLIKHMTLYINKCNTFQHKKII